MIGMQIRDLEWLLVLGEQRNVTDAAAACEGAHRVAWPVDLASPGEVRLPGAEGRG